MIFHIYDEQESQFFLFNETISSIQNMSLMKEDHVPKNHVGLISSHLPHPYLLRALHASQ